MFQEDGEPPVEFRTLSVKGLYPRALAEAKKWKEDAYLNGVSVWVAPKNDEHPLRATFGFDSKGNPEWLIVEYYEKESGVELTEMKTVSYPFGDGKPELGLNKVTLDSQEAFEKIYDEQGEEIFRKYPGMIYSITLSISKFPDEDLKWVAMFDPNRSVTWRIRMDAKTNRIVEVKIYD